MSLQSFATHMVRFESSAFSRARGSPSNVLLRLRRGKGANGECCNGCGLVKETSAANPPDGAPPSWRALWHGPCKKCPAHLRWSLDQPLDQHASKGQVDLRHLPRLRPFLWSIVRYHPQNHRHNCERPKEHPGQEDSHLSVLALKVDPNCR